MNKKFLIGLLVGLMLVLSACSVDQIAQGAGPDQSQGVNPSDGTTTQTNSGDTAVTPDAPFGQTKGPDGGPDQPRPTLSPDQEAAISGFSQVTIGILYLEDNQPGSITSEQASALLVTYQDIQTSLQAARDAAGSFPGPDGGQGGPDGDKGGTAGNGGGPGGNGSPPVDGTPQPGGPRHNGGPGGPGDGPGPDGHKGGRGGIDGFHILADQDFGKLQQYITSIRSSLTADQLATIDALTADQLAATLEQHGIGIRFQVGQHPADGTPGAPPPHQGTPSPDQVATFQAQGGPGGPDATGQRPNGNPVIEEVIKVLTEITS